MTPPNKKDRHRPRKHGRQPKDEMEYFREEILPNLKDSEKKEVAKFYAQFLKF